MLGSFCRNWFVLISCTGVLFRPLLCFLCFRLLLSYPVETAIMSMPSENITALPDRTPEVSLGIRDVRRVNASGRLGKVNVTQCRALVLPGEKSGKLPAALGFRPVTNVQTAALLSPVIAASWDNLSVRIVAGPGIETGLFTLVCGWAHSEIPVPTDSDEVATLPGASYFFFGTTKTGVVPPPQMLVPCPFSMGISRQAKPRDLYGGHPVFYVHLVSCSSSANADAVAFNVFFHGDLSIKGSDIVVA
jgi:hypothetical protein